MFSDNQTADQSNEVARLERLGEPRHIGELDRQASIRIAGDCSASFPAYHACEQDLSTRYSLTIAEVILFE